MSCAMTVMSCNEWMYALVEHGWRCLFVGNGWQSSLTLRCCRLLLIPVSLDPRLLSLPSCALSRLESHRRNNDPVND